MKLRANFVIQLTEKSPLGWAAYSKSSATKSIDDIPSIKEEYSPKELIKKSKQWPNSYGVLVKEKLHDGSYCIHAFDFDQFFKIYAHDAKYPVKESFRAMQHYRAERDLYFENVGYEASNCKAWNHLLRGIKLPSSVIQSTILQLDEASNSLINILHRNASRKITILPWLYRWSYEFLSVLLFNKRINAFSDNGMNEADKMVESAITSNTVMSTIEMLDLDFEKYFWKYQKCQDYMLSVAMSHITHAQSYPGNCLVKTLLKMGSEKRAITFVMDLYQEVLLTVPLTILMALYHLGRNEQLQMRTEYEVSTLFSESLFFFTGALKKLPEIHRIILETLRISPPLTGSRRILKEDIIVNRYLVPKGNTILLQVHAACLMGKYFEEPLEFRPQRQPTAYNRHLKFIFNDARKTRIEKLGAVDQIALVIAKVLQNFIISYEEGEVNMVYKIHSEPSNKMVFKLLPLL